MLRSCTAAQLGRALSNNLGSARHASERTLARSCSICVSKQDPSTAAQRACIAPSAHVRRVSPLDTHPTGHTQRRRHLSQPQGVRAGLGCSDVYQQQQQQGQQHQQQQEPADTRHLVVPRGGGRVSSVVAAELGDVTADRVRELIQLGAVYHAEVAPRPPAHLGAQAQTAYDAQVAVARASSASPSYRGTPPKPRRLVEDEAVMAGSYLRVHLRPQRFLRAQSVDWLSRIVDDTRDYLVLDKPAGVPVAATLDNCVDNCVEHLSRALRLPVAALPTHRLDICTEGLLVMAKSKEFAAHFQSLLRARQVRKVYAAVTLAAPPFGTLVHWSSDSKRAPQTFLRSAPPGDPRWKRCDLYILGQNHVDLPPVAVLEQIGCEAGELLRVPSLPGPPLQLCESIVRLGTGRTHQIRGQLAAEGCPVLGDIMYGPPLPSSIFPLSGQAGSPLHQSLGTSAGINARITDHEDACNVAGSQGCATCDARVGDHQRVKPNIMTITAIGLKAVELSWKGGPAYKAGTPWWRASTCQ